jgi:hypothetical protein
MQPLLRKRRDGIGMREMRERWMGEREREKRGSSQKQG